MNKPIFILFFLTSCQLFSQNGSAILKDTSILYIPQIVDNSSKLSIGSYTQIDYNQPVGGDTHNNGKLDVHRLVMTMAYRFNSKTRFFAEIEYEHVKEVFVEQAYLNYRLNNQINIKAGLFIIPMGIINEYHEPPTYNGVERPNVDKNIVPTTWREIGAGITGRFDEASLKYQLYVVNGFNGYDGSGKFRGKDGLRKGRQKGAESFISSPNFSGKLDYYGISGLKLGLSGYVGKSQSTMFSNLNESDRSAVSQADSSVIDIAMIGLDIRYNTNGWQLKGQYIFANLGNTNQYNTFTGKDLGSALQGFYLEAAYNLFHSKDTSEKLLTFVRYEKYNTHHKTEGLLSQNGNYNISEFIVGLGWKVTQGAIFKTDLQFIKSKADGTTKKQLNMGVGIWF